jgi:hypothetical protein
MKELWNLFYISIKVKRFFISSVHTEHTYNGFGVSLCDELAESDFSDRSDRADIMVWKTRLTFRL